MRITILIRHFPPKWLAGTEIATYHLAEHLSKRGHEIHVITSHDEGLPKFAQEKAFFVHRITFPRVRIIGVLEFWVKIFLKIHVIKPDIVHAQDLGMGIPAGLTGKILKIPYVVWGRGDDVYCPVHHVRIATKSILQNADATLVLTENMGTKLKNIYDTEIYVVPNGIDLGEYTGVTKSPEKESGIKNILFVGRLHPVKGVQYLIMAMKIVHDKIPDARLILVGAGKERERLEALSIQLSIKKYVQFIGEVPYEKVQTFMQQADVFVLPSLSEGFPNVILGAMAYGLPIVATQVGGIPDIITNGVNGYLVEVKNPDEIAEKILLLLQNNQLTEEISRTNKIQVKVYTWDNIIDKLENIYLKISKNTGKQLSALRYSK